MKEKYYKYAELLLKKGVCINKNQPLVINAPIEAIDFIRVLTVVACKLGVTDIYYDWYDDELKHTQLKYFDLDQIKESRFWNKEIHDEYAKKDAAFLFLTISSPDIMKDIDTNKLKIASEHSILTRKLYREMQENNQVDWCIAGVATDAWGKLLFPDSNNPKEDLWELLFDICLINEENSLDAWRNKMEDNKKICQKLNDLKIRELHYTNSLGTDLTIELTEDANWCGGTSYIKGRNPIVNLPTEEVFTTPNKLKTNGIVYTSLPLIHSGIMINNICLEFKDGKVVNYNASSGIEELKNTLLMDDESSLLGEVALVDITSPISKSKTLFYDTLYDENASCHLAFGEAYPECVNSKKNFKELGVNESETHVDFMIGTNDLEIIGETESGKQVTIMKNGKFKL